MFGEEHLAPVYVGEQGLEFRAEDVLEHNDGVLAAGGGEERGEEVTGGGENGLVDFEGSPAGAGKGGITVQPLGKTRD